MTGYRCIACARTQTADFRGFLCPACGGNLDITYDYNAIVDDIERSNRDSTGHLFSFAPFLPVKRPASRFPLRVGNTPLYAAGRLGQSQGLRNLYLKDDTMNPSASSKDRASTIVVQRAMDIGANIVSVASTGNAGSSLACVAAAVGMKSVVFVPETAPAAKLTQALAFGATVLAVRGTYDNAFELCLSASEEYGWFNRSTGYNPYTREGKKVCAFEIWEALDGRAPDRVVVPTGDGNLLSGMWKGWCDLKAVGLIDQLPKIDCAQSATSAAINKTIANIRDTGQSIPDWSELVIEEVRANTIADSISVDRPRDGLAAVKAIVESGGEAVSLSDSAILSAIPEMAALSGIFAEPAAAAAWAAVKQMVADGKVDADERIVCLVSGSGLKDVGSARASVCEPLVIDPTVEAVREALN